ncbi:MULTISPECIES: hypothetical protein [Idiomarinaceae]|uniref:Uncharacterized protein n=4 Tax=Pseudidiomarina TaxID=2800384 RepID=A0A368UZG8_9GAMM|nr:MULTISPECIES: hypothetical protein [Idiomarinaceae]MDT7524654.1 hypothetical protein [Pseudidiomarina sp. GXY010]MDX1525363.1 hypothetical protein [Pseudidiomarina maritima]PWW14481.1 hypothetical protein DET45_103173 [Pseudidiomarina maritima]RBP92519.1 hypothetical protein DFO81_10269 [Pseudidiomarina tainanensis]RCW34327.1 hypothetical protein DFO79_10369 [Pseudidiomarina tainanensis]
MLISAEWLQGLILSCLVLAAVAPLVLLLLWVRDWRQQGLW